MDTRVISGTESADASARLSATEGQEKPDYLWLLPCVSEDRPSGENLEFESDFYQLEVAATPKEEREYGDFVVAANDVDWRHVLQESARLLKRSRDLRLLALWHQAAVNLYGIGGLAAGFHVMRAWLETLWPTLHPELEDTDSTARWLCIAGAALNEGLLGAWRRSTLIASRAMTLSVKDFSLSVNRSAPPGVPGIDQIQAFLRENHAITRATLNDVFAIRAQIRQIDQIALDKGTGDASPDLQGFERLLDEIEYVFVPALPEGEKPDTMAELSPLNAPGVTSNLTDSASVLSACNSRGDAVRLLDQICQYFASNEPSHPAPLFLRRAQRLMQMDFMEIMKELLPGSVDQLDALAGTQRD